MPYIDEAARRNLDKGIDNVISHISTHSLYDREGACNYVISRIVAGSMKPEAGWRYKHLARAHGTFLAAGAEFYRRLVVPYEDKCIERNGDLPEYKDN